MSDAEDELREDATYALPRASFMDDYIPFVEDVTDEKIQRLFGKILAGEMEAEGSFSRLALSKLSQFSKLEVELIEKLCSVSTGGHSGSGWVLPLPIPVSYTHLDVYKRQGAGRAQRAFEVRTGGASMKIELLREFVALAHYGSFRAASEKLFVSQPTLSNHIKALEQELGFELFDRSRDNELTDEGALLLDAAQSALLIIDSTLEECRKRSEG